MKLSIKLPLLTVAVSMIFALPAHAGLLSDDEARKAILELRAKVESINELNIKEIHDLREELQSKADKRVALDLVNQIETMHQEIAQLRGLVEVLTHTATENQQQQKDFYKDLDARMAKLEPKSETIDGIDVVVMPEEKSSFENNITLLKSADYKGAIQGFTSFLKRFPASGYSAQAHHCIGIAYYALKDYKNSVSEQLIVTKQYPQSAYAPEALLNLASSYIELKNKAEAKKALTTLIDEYSTSTVANIGKERLGLLK